MRIFFSVGEPSGDLHGANLIRALQRRLPGAEFTGFGGPKMQNAGCQLLCDLTELAVMWVVDVLKNIRRFRGLLRDAERSFQEQRPDLVVLIDYPGFNWHVAKRAKALGIPVVYYGTPQLWAWAPWRVRKMRCFVDHALCKLPFEEKWFRDRGCNATFVGHPYFDELQSRRLDGQLVDRLKAESRPLVTLLPGSRDSEVRNNLPSLLRSAEMVARRVPETRFLVASFKEEQAQLARQMVEQHSVSAEVHCGQTPELIEAATCCMACSGSVSLELLYHGKPSVILYKVSRFGYFVQSFFRTVRYITLVNLLTADDPSTSFPAGRYTLGDRRDDHVLMPEYLTCSDRSAEVAEHVVGWLRDEDRRRGLQKKMLRLKQEVGRAGASERAADYIAGLLADSLKKRPGPSARTGNAA